MCDEPPSTLQIFPGSATPWHRICPRAPSAAAAAPKCPPSVTTLWMRPTVEECHVYIWVNYQWPFQEPKMEVR